MAMPRIVPWGLFAAVLAGTSALWHGLRPPAPAARPEPTPEERAEAAGLHPTRLIIDYRDDISTQYLAQTPYQEQPVSDYSAVDRVYRAEFRTADEATSALRALARDTHVESVDYDSDAFIPPNEAIAVGKTSLEQECNQGGDKAAGAATPADGSNPTAYPNDPCYRYQWHLRQVGMPEAWKLGQGTGVVVAVIDTGVSRVADLADTTFAPGFNFFSNTPNADDDHGHGTHVAGTIAQSTNNGRGVAGVAFGATIMPIKVLSASGSGSMAGIAQGIRWAADHGAQVINMSLGGRFPVATIGSAVKYARAKGVTVVAAAGNDGAGRVSYPARYPGVVAVAATQFDETTTFYSNWGREIDIAAPGGNVRVDQNGDGQPDGVLQHTIVPGDIKRTDYLWFMGTSMASPHVAGVAALIVGAGIRKPDAVEQVLLDTARKPKTKEAAGATDARVDDHYGAGVVDAAAALRKVRAGRGAGEMGIGCGLALLGVCLLRRRGRPTDRLGLGFLLALVAGSSGLFLLPFFFDGPPPPVVNILSSGFTMNISNVLGPNAYGNPLLWSAIAPLVLTVLFYGVGRLRPILAGFGFGIAGTLLFAALAGIVDVRYVPDFLDRFWLGAHATVAAIFASAVIRK
ncbi:MAG TPA: S8 family serine peptidase [Polyangia bacterium]|nr:S8 family serine peptidase [Polyangia bacterium]